MIDYVVILLAMGLIWVTIATIFDVKTKEVPNWLNFSLIIVALAFRLIYSIATNDYWIILGGLMGLGIFLIVANLLYYAKAFGGGDAKLLIALGTILWISTSWKISAIYSGAFIMLLLIVGFFYGIIMSGIMLATSKKETKKEFRKELLAQIENNKKILALTLILVIIATFSSIYYGLVEMIILTSLLIIMPLLLIYSKAIEKTIMIKKISVSKLRIGDWLYKDVKLSGGKIIESKFDGVNEEELKLIKKKLDYVQIRDGVAFVPAFLIAYIITICLWYSGLDLITNLLSLI